MIRAAGFADVRIAERKPVLLPDEVLREPLSADEVSAFRASAIGIQSVTVLASKSAACCGPACCS